MSDTKPFQIGPTTKITVSSSNQVVSIDPYLTNQAARIFVAPGTGNVYFRFTNNPNDIASSTTDMPMAAGTVETFNKSATQYIAIIADSSATVFVTVGDGI